MALRTFLLLEIKEGSYTFQFAESQSYEAFYYRNDHLSKFSRGLCHRPENIIELNETKLNIKKADTSKQFQDCINVYKQDYHSSNKSNNIECKLVKIINCNGIIHYDSSSNVSCDWAWKQKEKEGHFKESSGEELTITLSNTEYIHDAGWNIIDIPRFATGEMDVVGYLRCSTKDSKYDTPFHVEEPFVVRYVTSMTQTHTETSDTNTTVTTYMKMEWMYILFCSLFLGLSLSMYLCYRKKQRGYEAKSKVRGL